MTSNDWDGAHWFKAGDSNDVGCVEVAFHDGKVGVRDTKDRSKAPHVFTRNEWECFLAGVKQGEFDLPE
jgi:Domain of unknown function (DUF397)